MLLRRRSLPVAGSRLAGAHCCCYCCHAHSNQNCVHSDLERFNIRSRSSWPKAGLPPGTGVCRVAGACHRRVCGSSSGGARAPLLSLRATECELGSMRQPFRRDGSNNRDTLQMLCAAASSRTVHFLGATPALLQVTLEPRQVSVTSSGGTPAAFAGDLLVLGVTEEAFEVVGEAPCSCASQAGGDAQPLGRHTTVPAEGAAERARLVWLPAS